MHKVTESTVVKTRAGNENPLLFAIGMSSRSMRMLDAYVNEEVFRVHYDKGESYATLGKNFDITERDARALTLYWDFPKRERVIKVNSSKAIDVDALAERLWINIEPKIDAKISQLIDSDTLHLVIKRVIEQVFNEGAQKVLPES